jgi:hypothetical protein
VLLEHSTMVQVQVQVRMQVVLEHNTMVQVDRLARK